MLSWTETVSAILGLGCVFLAGRNSKYNFWVGYAYNVFLFLLFWKENLYAAMCLQPVAFAINIFGHYRWTHPKEGEKSAKDATRLKVSRMNGRYWMISLAAVALMGFLWALVLDRTEDPSPWLDSYILSFTFLAQYLSAQKKWECWFVWLLINVANIVLYLRAGMYIMPLVSLLYLINGIWSLICWKKLYVSKN